MRKPEFKRLPASLLGILFFLLLIGTYASMFMVQRRSEMALLGLQKTFMASHNSMQEARIAQLLDPESKSLSGPRIEPMASAVLQFKNLSPIQWLPRGESPALRLEKAWEDWLNVQGIGPGREQAGIQLLSAISQSIGHLELLKHRTSNAFDLIIFLSGMLFSLGTSGSIAFYARLRQSRLKEEFAAANLKKALEAEDAIRKTIAMELHDDIAQDIAAARMLCERIHCEEPGVARLAHRATKTLGEVNQKIRVLCTELRPPALEQTGLQEAVRAFCEAESRRLSRSLLFLPQGAIPRLAQETEENLYRIIREAVVNATKHAKDGAIEIRTWLTQAAATPEKLSIEIRDGGFEYESRSDSRGFGFGITTMRERAKLIGAELSVQLDPQGSVVKISLPLK